MSLETFEDFASAARADGYDEILQREWVPGTALGSHAHPFAVRAIVACGEMWLTVGDGTRHLGAGGGFVLDRDVVHGERYGPDGCTLWVARRRENAGGTR